MNCIGYSIFGYNKQHDGCFSFGSYLRGLSLNLRMASLIFPQWHIHIAIDDATYNSPYKSFFDYHKQNNERIHVTVVPNQELCLMMLQRLLPIFTGFDRVICRDIDSLITYRERQAVDFWVNSGRTMSAITDSISHCIPLMGGMIGANSQQFKTAMGVDTFDALIALGENIDYTRKGSDQDFLNRVVLPKVADSMVEHYVLGMKNSFRDMCFNFIQDIVIEDIPPILKESNLLVNHIGQSGANESPVLKFFKQYLTIFQQEYFLKPERSFSDIFYWVHEL